MASNWQPKKKERIVYFTAETMFIYITNNYTNNNCILAIFIAIFKEISTFNNSGITESFEFSYSF